MTPEHLSVKKITVLLLAVVLLAVAPVSAQTPLQQECLELIKHADSLKQRNKTEEAVAAYERAAELAPKAFGADAVSTGNVYHHLAKLYESVGKLDKAALWHERNLKIRAVRWGEDSPQAAMIMNNLAILYKELGWFDKAEPLYRKNLRIVEDKFGPEHYEFGKALNNWALFLEETGRYDQVETLLQRSLKIYEKEKGADHPDVAIPLGNLAQMYRFFGQYARAEAMMRKSLKLREDKFGPDHDDVASSLNNLAALQEELGQHEQAGALLRRALGIWEKNLGPEHPTVAIGLNNLAAHFMELGKYEEAEPLLLRSLKIHEAAGPGNLEIARARHNLGNLYSHKREYPRAEVLLRSALKIREDQLGLNHAQVADALGELSTVLMVQGKFAEGMKMTRRELEIREKIFAPDHPRIAGTLGSLAAFHENLRQPEQAAALWLRSLEIYKKHYGVEHPAVTDRFLSLSNNRAFQGQWDQAVDFMNQGRRSQLVSLRRVLAGLSEAEQIRYLQTKFAIAFDNGSSLGVLRAGDPKHVTLSAEWVINSKGLAREVLAERVLLTRDLAHSEQADKVRALLSLRKQIAGFAFTDSAAVKTIDRKKLEEMLAREEELSRSLGGKLGRPVGGSPWVDLQRVRAALPAGGVLVEIARFDFQDFTQPLEKRYRGPHFAAWVIPAAGAGDMHLVLLGKAKPIEDAVARVRRDLVEAPKLIRTIGDIEAEQAARASLKELARLVYVPLAKHLDPAKHWVLSPDAELWLVPWCALPVAETNYAVEKHSIRYVVSGRDLVKNPGPASDQPALVLANPDFDLGLEEARAESKRLRGDPGTSVSLSRSVRPQGGLPQVAALPGTAAEAEAVKPHLKALTGKEPKVLLEKQALEEAFKSARQPRVLVLSTHGFFLEDQRPADAGARFVDPSLQHPLGKLQENPLLRCGLLLAGCNRREQEQGAEDDGVLTGLEVLEADLHGTELVVLSACETGLGVVHNGEGVAGLKQAFQLAGAHAVLATLWPIPDVQSAQLMIRFFTQMADGKTRAEALQFAQQEVIRKRRDRYGAAHPFFWAAFTVTGK